MKTRLMGCMGLALLFASLGFAQGQQDALDLLAKVGQAYRSAKTLQAEGDLAMGMKSPGLNQDMTMHLLLTLASPDKIRIQSTGLMSFLLIFDGQAGWIYMPALNKYSKLPSTAASAADASIAPGLPGAGMVPDFAKVADGIKEARIVRSEILELDGVATDCYVIEVLHNPSQPGAEVLAQGTPAGATTESATEILWVDKARLLVVRVSRDMVTLAGHAPPDESKTKSTITFTKLTLDGPVSDDAFVFTPPDGATEMDLGQFMPQGALPAPPPLPAP